VNEEDKWTHNSKETRAHDDLRENWNAEIGKRGGVKLVQCFQKLDQKNYPPYRKKKEMRDRNEKGGDVGG